MHSVLVIAQAFLDQARGKGQAMTGMRLHKLVFLAQIHHHAMGLGRLIREDAEAWAFGPIYARLWKRHAMYGSSPLPAHFDFTDTVLTGEPARFVAAILHGYRLTSAIELSALVRVPSSPWTRTKEVYAANDENDPPRISDVLMKEYGESLRRDAVTEQTLATPEAVETAHG